MDRLTHGRYEDGKENTIQYSLPKPTDYKVRAQRPQTPPKKYGKKAEAGETLEPIPIQKMRDAVKESAPELLSTFDNRVKALESLISLDFDAGALHVAALSKQSCRHGNRYFDEIQPCYSYATLKEAHSIIGPSAVRAASGKYVTNFLPLFLTKNHGESFRQWLHSSFTRLASVTINGNMRGQFHALWIPDAISNLMTQAIVDFAKGNVCEPGIQFVLDCLRTVVYCATAVNGTGGSLMFDFVPSIKTFLRNFVHHPEERTRDKIPDLGDLFQWLSILCLVENDDEDDESSWEKDIVHAMLVETMRRQARWVTKNVIEYYELTRGLVKCGTELVPHRYKKGTMFAKARYRRETKTEMVMRFLKCLSKREMLEVWWQHGGGVSGRVLLYSHSFYATFAQGKSIQSFEARYDPVMGAAYPEDLQAMRMARAEIEQIGGMLEFFRQAGYPASEAEIHHLCLWAMENQDGYREADPLHGGWKGRSKKKQETLSDVREPRITPRDKEADNRFSVFDSDDEEDEVQTNEAPNTGRAICFDLTTGEVTRL